MTENLPAQKPKNAYEAIRKDIEAYLPEIRVALPVGVSEGRFGRMMLTAIRLNPTLLACDRLSLFAGMMQIAQAGLEPGVTAHLIPFTDRKAGHKVAVLVIGYQGYVARAYRSGQIKSVEAHLVYKGDEFEYELGTNKHLRHVPALIDDRQDQDITHVYAIAQTVYGGEVFEILSRSQIDKARGQSKDKRDDAVWKTNYPDMARKTAMRRLQKWLPQEAEKAPLAQIDGTVKRSFAVDMSTVPDAEDPDIFRGEVVDAEYSDDIAFGEP